MTSAQVRIATTMESFYDNTSPMGPAGIEYKRAIEKLDEEAKSNLVSKMKCRGDPFRSCIKPMSRIMLTVQQYLNPWVGIVLTFQKSMRPLNVVKRSYWITILQKPRFESWLIDQAKILND